MNLGTISDLMVSVRKISSILEIDSDNAPTVDKMRDTMVKVAKDTETLIRLHRAIRVAAKATEMMREAPISFFGGSMPTEDVDDPVDDLPRRAREASDTKDKPRRPKAYGRKEDD